MNSMLLLILLLVVLFLPTFLMTRRQKRHQEELRSFQSQLSLGDQIITGSGIHGMVVGLDEQQVRIEIAPKVEITVERAGILRYADSQPQIEEEPETSEDDLNSDK